MTPTTVKLTELSTAERVYDAVVGRRPAAVDRVAVHGGAIYHELAAPIAITIAGTLTSVSLGVGWRMRESLLELSRAQLARHGLV